MRLTREQVVHIAALCRVGMTEADLDRAAEQLGNILEQFEVLKQVNTDGVAPTAQSIELDNVFRDDVSAPSLSRDDALKNAPQRDGDFVRVKAVLED